MFLPASHRTHLLIDIGLAALASGRQFRSMVDGVAACRDLLRTFVNLLAGHVQHGGRFLVCAPHSFAQSEENHASGLSDKRESILARALACQPVVRPCERLWDFNGSVEFGCRLF